MSSYATAAMISHALPTFLQSPTLALDLFQYSHYINAFSAFATFLVVVFHTPEFLKGSHAARYAQVLGFGFLAFTIQSYHCATSVEDELTESLAVITGTIVLFNLVYPTLSWPLRIEENSPPACAAEKFFFVLTYVAAVGMIPALLLD